MANLNIESSQQIPIIKMEGICKQFPGVLANDHVDLNISNSEIHALLGENGDTLRIL
jgi:ABC-type uncharacterized transport system ATPase subunit